MSHYLYLIYADESQYANMTPQAMAAMRSAHDEWATTVMGKGGTIHSGEALQPSTTSTTIRAGEPTPGPFTSGKEALGGIYVVEAEDMNQAIEFGALLPAGEGGSVESRPVMQFS